MFSFVGTGISLECHMLARIFETTDRTKTIEFFQDLKTYLKPNHHKKSILFKSLSDYKLRITSCANFNQTLLNNDPEAIPLTDSELKEGPMKLKELIETGKLGALFEKHNVFFLFDDSEFDENYKGLLSNVRLLIFSFLIKSISL
ncbi:hypothetical protein KM759_gp017 [Lymphocystis disease virus 4]|uniref:Uncharacterized protein n=1 Tax=Lymphocystis disease virus 4 TaxID=2704413 RepID=A0A6B9XJZ2_9VIRU|nr:hypothetical protein KM759_gp017 [Lymphocystis disease virus 4]QHR78535.1 hypothetical protein [Lymphocystis disease virus 4]